MTAAPFVAGCILIYPTVPQYQVADCNVDAAAIGIGSVARNCVVFKQEAPRGCVNRAAVSRRLVFRVGANIGRRAAIGHIFAKGRLVDKERLALHILRPIVMKRINRVKRHGAAQGTGKIAHKDAILYFDIGVDSSNGATQQVGLIIFQPSIGNCQRSILGIYRSPIRAPVASRQRDVVDRQVAAFYPKI